MLKSPFRTLLGCCSVLVLLPAANSFAQAPAVPTAPPQLQFLTGHTGPVYAVASSPDGTTLLSAGKDGTIRAWDRATGQPIRIVGDHLPGIVSLTVSPLGLQLAAGGLDGRVRMFDLPSNYPRAIVPNMPNVGGKIAVLADGSAALTSDSSRALRLWDLKTNLPLRDFAGATGDITAILIVSHMEQPPAPPAPVVPAPAAAPAANAPKEGEKKADEKKEVEPAPPVELPPPVLKPKYILAAAKDGTLRAWDFVSAQPVGAIMAAPQTSLAASKKGELLVGAGEDGLLRSFRWPLTAPVSLAGHGDQVTSVAIAADGKLLVTGSLDLKVTLFKAEDGTVALALAGQPGKTTSVAINKDSSLVAGGSDLGTIKFWAAADGADRLTIAGHTGAVSRLAFSPQAKQLASAGADGTVRVWNFPVASRPVPGHAGPVLTVAATADGKTALSSGADKQVRLWTVATGEEIRAIKDLPQAIAAAAFSADGKQLALGDAIGTVTLQDTAAGKTVTQLAAHAGPVTGVAFDPTAKRLFTSSADGTLKYWTLPLTPPKTLIDGEQPITGLAIATDGKFFVTGTADGKAQMLESASGEPLKKLAGETGVVSAITLSADNALLAMGNAAGAVNLWKTADGAAVGGIAGHTGAVNAVAMHPKEPLLATAGEDGTVRVWQMPVAAKPVATMEKGIGAISVSPDGALAVIGGTAGKANLIKLADGKPVAALAGQEAGVTSGTFKKDGTSLATGDEKGAIRLFSPADGASQGTLLAHEGAVTGLAYNPVQALLASTGADGTLKIWQLPLPAPIPLAISKAAVNTIAVSADGALTLVAGADQSFKIFDANGTQTVAVEKLAAAINTAGFTADGKLVLLGLANGAVEVRNSADGVLLAQLAGQPGGVTSLAVNSKAPQVATAGKDGSLRIWAIPTEVKPLGNHTAGITALSISPNGQLVASASADKSVRIWKTADGSEVWALGHNGPVTALAWKADSAQLATADGKSVRLWNVADGQQLATFGEHAGPVTGVCFNADGTAIVSAGADKLVQVWKVAPATDEEKLPVKLPAHAAPITALASAGAMIATGSEDGVVRTWNLAESKPAVEFKHAGPVTALAVSTDQKFIAVGSKDKQVKLYSAADGAAGAALAGLDAAVAKLVFSGDSLRVAAVGADGTIRVWSVGGDLIDVLSAGGTPATTLAFAPDHKILAVGAADGKVRILPPALVREIKASDKALTSLVYTADGTSILAGAADKTVKLWTPADGKAVREFAGATGGVTAVALSVDGTKVFAASEDKAVREWNLADAMLVATFTHPAVVHSLAASADNTKLVTGAEDAAVRVWHLVSGRLWQQFPAHTKAVSAVAFYPDSKTFISGSADETALKSVLGGTLLLPAHAGGAAGVVFTNDGLQVITGGADKLVKQCDLAGTAVKQFAGAEGAIRSLALKPDGLQLAAGSEDKHVHFWTVANGAVERKVLTPAAVGQISYTTDGLRLAAAGADDALRVIGTVDGRLLETQTVPAALSAVSFLPDGKTLLLGDAKGSAAVQTLSLVRMMAGVPAGAATCVAFAPNGTQLISGGADKNLHLWTLADGALVRSMVHTDVVTGAAISADSTFAWTSSADKLLRTWNLTTGVVAFTITTDQPLRSLAVSPDGTRAVVSADDKTARVYDLAAQRELQRFAGHMLIPHKLALAADNKTLLTAGEDRSVRKWTIDAERVIVADVGKVNALAMFPDGTKVVSAGDDKIAKVWDLTGKLVTQYAGNPTAIKTVAVRPDGLQVALGGDPASAQVNVYLFNAADGVAQPMIVTPAGIHTLTYSADGKLAVSGADNHLRVYDPAAARLLQDLTSPVVPGSIVFSNNSTLLAAGADNQTHVFTYSLDRIIAAHTGAVTGLAYSPDGTQLFSSGADKTVKQLNLADGAVARLYVTAEQPVADLALSEDGKRLAAACVDNNVRVWDVPAAGDAKAAAAVPPAATLLHPAVITAVGLNGDGSRLAVGCNDAFVHMWDLKLGLEIERLAGNTTTINSVKVSADGATVLSGGVDKTAWRWKTTVKSAVLAGKGPLSSVACTADGSLAFTAGADGAVQSWQAADLAPQDKFAGMPVGVTLLATSPEGKCLAAVGADGTAQLWAIEGAKAVVALKTPVPAVSVALGDEGRKLIVAGNDNAARCYGLTEVEGKPALELKQSALGATLPLTSLALSTDDHTLVVVSDDRNIRRYYVASDGPTGEFEAHTRQVFGLSYSVDGTRLATAGGDHTVAVWDMLKNELVTRCTGHTRQVQGVSFHPNGQAVASAALDGTVRVWSLAANLPGERPEMPAPKVEEKATISASTAVRPLRPREPGLIAERFSTNNLTGDVVVSVDKQIDFDWEAKKPDPFSARWNGFLTAPFTGEVTFIAEADDGLRLYLAGKAIIDGVAANGPREGKLMLTAGEALPIQLQFYQTADKALFKLYWKWEGQEKQLIPATAFSHQPVYVGDQIAQFTDQVQGGLTTVRYSLDGSTIVAAGTGKKWYLWPATDNKLAREGIGHNQTIYSLVYNPAGTRLATIDYSGNIFIWDPATATPMYHQQLPAWAGYSAVYTGDATELILGTSDPRVMRATLPVPVR